MASGKVVVRVATCRAFFCRVLCFALAFSWCSQLTCAARKTEKDSSTMSTGSQAKMSSEATASDPGAALPLADKRPYSDEAVKHYNRGVELHQSGFLNQAISAYKEAIDADNRMEEAYSNLGLIYAAQRNYNKAIEAFNKALSLKPARPTTLNGLGTVLYAKGKLKEAMEKWKQAIAVDSQFASAYFNMGNALENEKDFQNAVNAYHSAIKINPGMADAYYRIGTIFNKDKHLAQASILLSRAIELSPDADFVRDAKKQLAQLEGEFSRNETKDPEVKMNLMPPPVVPGAKSDASHNVNMFVQPSQQLGAQKKN